MKTRDMCIGEKQVILNLRKAGNRRRCTRICYGQYNNVESPEKERNHQCTEQHRQGKPATTDDRGTMTAVTTKTTSAQRAQGKVFTHHMMNTAI